jgi:hypothetical protein
MISGTSGEQLAQVDAGHQRADDRAERLQGQGGAHRAAR